MYHCRYSRQTISARYHNLSSIALPTTRNRPRPCRGFRHPAFADRGVVSPVLIQVGQPHILSITSTRNSISGPQKAHSASVDEARRAGIAGLHSLISFFEGGRDSFCLLAQNRFFFLEHLPSYRTQDFHRPNYLHYLPQNTTTIQFYTFH